MQTGQDINKHVNIPTRTTPYHLGCRSNRKYKSQSQKQKIRSKMKLLATLSVRSRFKLKTSVSENIMSDDESPPLNESNDASDNGENLSSHNGNSNTSKTNTTKTNKTKTKRTTTDTNNDSSNDELTQYLSKLSDGVAKNELLFAPIKDDSENKTDDGDNKFSILFDANSFVIMVKKHMVCDRCGNKYNENSIDCSTRGNYTLTCSNCGKKTKIQNQEQVRVGDKNRSVPALSNLSAIVAASNGVVHDKYDQIIRSLGLHTVGSNTYYSYASGELYEATRDTFYRYRDELLVNEILDKYSEMFDLDDDDDLLPLCIMVDTRWAKRTKNHDSLDGTTWISDALTGYLLEVVNHHRQTPSGSRSNTEDTTLFEQPSGTYACVI